MSEPSTLMRNAIREVLRLAPDGVICFGHPGYAGRVGLEATISWPGRAGQPNLVVVLEQRSPVCLRLHAQINNAKGETQCGSTSTDVRCFGHVHEAVLRHVAVLTRWLVFGGMDGGGRTAADHPAVLAWSRILGLDGPLRLSDSNSGFEVDRDEPAPLVPRTVILGDGS